MTFWEIPESTLSLKMGMEKKALGGYYNYYYYYYYCYYYYYYYYNYNNYYYYYCYDEVLVLRGDRRITDGQ